MARKEGKSDVEVYVGTNDPAGIQIEYGNVNHPAQPYARNTWDSMKRSILGSIKEYLSEEIIKTIARQTKKRMGR